jgi:raffinose/stachyose/melibiose transport system permease protein
LCHSPESALISKQICNAKSIAQQERLDVDFSAVVAYRPITSGKRKLGFWASFKKYVPIYLFLVPTFVFLLIFTYYPILSALIHSLYRWDGVHAEFVGLANFREMFTVDRAFMTSLLNVLRLTAFRVGVALTVPLLAAEVIFGLKNERTAYFWRVLLIVPMVIPWVVLILVWLFIYDPQMGILNTLLRGIGLGRLALLWLGDTRLALWCIAFYGFPWVSGLNLLIYLAGLDAIPLELLDAAAIDGASRFKRILRVDIPMIMGQIKLIFIMTIITQLQNFQDILIFTNGGPGQSTFVPGLVLYHSAFYYSKMGYASAIGVSLFVVILIITTINMKYIRSGIEYVPEG